LRKGQVVGKDMRNPALLVCIWRGKEVLKGRGIIAPPFNNICTRLLLLLLLLFFLFFEFVFCYLRIVVSTRRRCCDWTPG
jgi:hypothetical protein